jgi:anion-transporting  ArsA/GET3 family ATPase
MTVNGNAGATGSALLDRQLVMVTGKGGTGKTTFASAIAMLSAKRGQKTLLCEVDSQHPALAPIVGCSVGFEDVEVQDNLWASNLLWEPCLKNYLVGALRSTRLVNLMLSNAGMSRFLDFTPGAREMVILSTLIDKCEGYDMVVVDMPASGHAFSLIDITRSAMGLFRSGPVRKQALKLREAIEAKSSELVFVALPDEMVVNETIETIKRTVPYRHASQSPTVFLNRSVGPQGTLPEAWLEGLMDGPLSDSEAALLSDLVWDLQREQASKEATDRLFEVNGQRPWPVSVAPPGHGMREHVRHVMDVLEGLLV